MNDAVDLDDLSSAYRHRPITASGRDRATMSAGGARGIAIDVGGGIGAHAEVFAALGLRPVVVDLNAGMCRQATDRGLDVVQASSEDLPIRSDSAGLVYFHLSIHYGDWRRVLDEAYRVAEPGGRIEIWTFGEAGIRSSSLARWFPTVGDIDAERFPDPHLVASHLRELGTEVGIEDHPDRVERRAGDWVDAVRGRFVSTLQLIDPDEIERGLSRFLEAHPDPDAPYAYTLAYRRITSLV